MNYLSMYAKNAAGRPRLRVEKFMIERIGLRDKTGRYIHYGDILADEFNNLLTPVIEVEHGEHVMFFKPLKHLNSQLKIGCKSTYSDTLVVVGNLYDEITYKGLQ